jgi:hypothetical protein
VRFFWVFFWGGVILNSTGYHRIVQGGTVLHIRIAEHNLVFGWFFVFVSLNMYIVYTSKKRDFYMNECDKMSRANTSHIVLSTLHWRENWYQRVEAKTAAIHLLKRLKQKQWLSRRWIYFGQRSNCCEHQITMSRKEVGGFFFILYRVAKC